jgi:RNA polymerase sigma-70 factor (ECF subfamily)
MEPEDLVRRIAAGDPQAEEDFIRRYQRPLREILRRRTGDHELAQDLLQDTFAVVLERLRHRGLEDPGKLAAFLHRTACNLAIGHFRRESRRRTDADSERVQIQPDPQGSLLDRVLRDEAGSMVRRLLSELRTPRDREVLMRFYVREQEKPAICAAIGLKPEQFDRVISRARQRFRALVEQSLADIGERERR